MWDRRLLLLFSYCTVIIINIFDIITALYWTIALSAQFFMKQFWFDLITDSFLYIIVFLKLIIIIIISHWFYWCEDSHLESYCLELYQYLRNFFFLRKTNNFEVNRLSKKNVNGKYLTSCEKSFINWSNGIPAFPNSFWSSWQSFNILRIL